MKPLTRLGIVAGLVGVFLSARDNQSSRAQSQAANEASVAAQGTSGLAKPCSDKNPPPCATPPRLVHRVSAEYSDEARRANYQGTCVVSAVVGTDGRTSHLHMLSSVGMGLDEKAMEAVRKWKFKPAMMDGKPVAVEIAVEVSFSLPGVVH